MCWSRSGRLSTPRHAKSKTSPAICAVRSRSTRRKATVGWQSFWRRFIETADGCEIYFHRNAVLDGAYRRLRGGSEVRFVEVEGAKGSQASTVRLIGKQASITSYRGSAACGFLSGWAISGEAGRRRELLRSPSTGDVDEGDLLVARSVEAHNRFRRRLQDHATTLLVKIRARFRR